ncbi:MAG: crotonase/enoyl-CoA hydratase family protein [Saprospiraceae bacterium]|nr:crotonase/enoyl-CoA hydratase family protein [Saprospiraceae bacterium]|tara:strand:- start:3539 stop:4357 length:819 start_codon:yes stop_codon:yes gene_type:complete
MQNRVTVTISNHIADVRLNRPDKMNALDQEMFNALVEAGEAVGSNPTVRCVVLSGEGRAFCAGMDTSNFNPNSKGGILNEPIPSRTHGVANIFQKVAWIWREIPVPVIAAVHGVAIGGGLNIMSGADIKFITADTKLSIMELKWGMIPDMAGSQLWKHTVRDDIIRELTYTHRIFSGEDAVKYGFATHISESPYDDAMKIAREIAAKNPSAVIKAKKVINEAPYLNAADGLMMESIEQSEITGRKNQIEAVMAATQKRQAIFDDYRAEKSLQ